MRIIQRVAIVVPFFALVACGTGSTDEPFGGYSFTQDSSIAPYSEPNSDPYSPESEYVPPPVSTETPEPPETTAIPETTVPPATRPPAKSSNCDPNYSGACVPIASDVDCAGGSGNGPAYVEGPVTVVGTDIYELDRDGDGTGCDS